MFRSFVEIKIIHIQNLNTHPCSYITHFSYLDKKSMTNHHIAISEDFCEVDILEEVDVEGDEPARFNLEWMVKVIYIIKPDYS